MKKRDFFKMALTNEFRFKPNNSKHLIGFLIEYSYLKLVEVSNRKYKFIANKVFQFSYLGEDSLENVKINDALEIDRDSIPKKHRIDIPYWRRLRD